MGELFQRTARSDGKRDGTVVGVAVAANVWDTYDYAWPAGWNQPKIGMRVRVSFGRGDGPKKKLTRGVIVRVGDRKARRNVKLKLVSELIDPQPQLDGHRMALARWISDYYLTPLGLVLPAMVPTAVGRHSPRRQTVAYLTSAPADWPRQLGARQRRMLDELLEARRQGTEPVALEDLRRHSGATGDTVGRLLNRKLIRTETRPVVLDSLTDKTEPDPFELNTAQRAAAGEIVAALDAGFTPMLLHGVTGSGKTEVYIRAIRAAVAAGRQAILLTPEIALATQTLQRLVRRLERVAVLHSGLTDAQRAFYYQQIREGHAAVVIGPRSAVFAPTPRLGLVIVDEEHEGSYKQDSAPRYHGRDVAVKRAQMAGVPIVLGTATPSLETWHNVQRGRYRRLELPRRVKGLAMPALKLVHLRKDLTPGRVELIGRTLTAAVARALDAGEQIILLMNRRGYASYVFCPSCQWQMECDDCSRPMVFHRTTQLVMCHYCRRTAALPQYCPACGKKLLLFGMGVQRIEDELDRKFPLARVARMDSDTMTSAKQFTHLLEEFRGGEIDILLGTQMVAKGLDFPRVSLVGVVSADTSLAIPDFRSAERTFQLVVQVAGRAGRSKRRGEVIVQTLHADEPAIQRAVDHDFEGFAAGELPHRRELELPPYGRIVRLLVRHAKAQVCQDAAEQLGQRLQAVFTADTHVRVMTPAIAPIARIRKQFRWQILLIADSPSAIQGRLKGQMNAIARMGPAEVITDVDPVSLA